MRARGFLHHRSTRSFPELLHCLQERLGLTEAVELQVDHDVVGLVPWPKDFVTSNACFHFSKFGTECSILTMCVWCPLSFRLVDPLE